MIRAEFLTFAYYLEDYLEQLQFFVQANFSMAFLNTREYRCRNQGVEFGDLQPSSTLPKLLRNDRVYNLEPIEEMVTALDE